MSHSPAGASPVTYSKGSIGSSSAAAYRLPDGLSSLAALSVAGGSSPVQSPMKPVAKELFHVPVNGPRQPFVELQGSLQRSTAAGQLGQGAGQLHFHGAAPVKPGADAGEGAGSGSASQSFESDEAAAAKLEPFVTSGGQLGTRGGSVGSPPGSVLPWVEVDRALGSSAIRHTTSWTEWTAPPATAQSGADSSPQCDSSVSLLDL